MARPRFSKFKFHFLRVSLVLASIPFAFSAPPEAITNPAQKIAICLRQAIESLPESWKELIDERYNKSRSHFPKFHTTSLASDWSNVHSQRMVGGIDLARRFLAGEDHAVWLEKLGAVLRYDSEGKPVLILPEDPWTIFERANSYIDQYQKEGKLSSDQVLHLALPFEAISKDTRPSIIFVRPGIDPMPNAEKYEPNFNLPQLSYSEWMKNMADGKFPLSLGLFIDHDLGHYTELLSQPELMAETRDFYTRLSRAPENWNALVSDNSTWPTHPQAKAFVTRLLFVTEEFAVPDSKKAGKIKELLPQLFKSNDVTDFKIQKNILNSLSQQDLVLHARSFLKNYNDLLLRQGGASRDSTGHLKMADDEVIEMMVNSGVHSDGTRADFKTKAELKRLDLVRCTPENLLSAQYEILEILRRIDASTKNPSRSPGIDQKLYDLLRDRLARVETAFANGIKLKITPTQILHDGGQFSMDPHSTTARWLSTFLLPSTAMWNAFLSPEAQSYPKELIGSH